MCMKKERRGWGKVGIRINNGCERKRGGKKTKGGSVLNPNPKSTLNNPKHEHHRLSSSVNPIPMKSSQRTPEKQKQRYILVAWSTQIFPRQLVTLPVLLSVEHV